MRPPASYWANEPLARPQFSCLTFASSSLAAAFFFASCSSSWRFLNSASALRGSTGPFGAEEEDEGAAAVGAGFASIVFDFEVDGQGDCEYTVLPFASTHLKTCACACAVKRRVMPEARKSVVFIGESRSGRAARREPAPLRRKI